MLRSWSGSFRKVRDGLLVMICLHSVIVLYGRLFDHNAHMADRLVSILACIPLIWAIVCICAKYWETEMDEGYLDLYNRILALVSVFGSEHDWSIETFDGRDVFGLEKKDARIFITITRHPFSDGINFGICTVTRFDLSIHADRAVRASSAIVMTARDQSSDDMRYDVPQPSTARGHCLSEQDLEELYGKLAASLS